MSWKPMGGEAVQPTGLKGILKSAEELRDALEKAKGFKEQQVVLLEAKRERLRAGGA